MNVVVILFVALTVIAIFWFTDQYVEWKERKNLVKNLNKIYKEVIDKLDSVVKDNESTKCELYGSIASVKLFELFESIKCTYNTIETLNIHGLRMTYEYAMNKLIPNVDDLVEIHDIEFKQYKENQKKLDDEVS